MKKILTLPIFFLNTFILATTLHAAVDLPVKDRDPGQSRQLAFKETPSVDVSPAQLVLVTLVMIAGAAGIVLLIRKYSPGLQSLNVRGERRLKLIEAVRLSPKAALFLIECDGQSILLAQCGDHLTVIDSNRRQPLVPASQVAA